MNLSIRTRLTAWFVLLFTMTLAALSFFLVLELKHGLLRAIDEEAEAGALELTRILGGASIPEPGDEPGDFNDSEHVEDFTEAARAILVSSGGAAQLIDADGRVTMRFGDIADGGPLASVARRQEAGSGRTVLYTTSLGEPPIHYRVRVSELAVVGDKYSLVLTLPLRSMEVAVQRVVLLLMVGGPAALGITALTAYWLAGKALQPVKRVTADADEIGIGQLHERVVVPTSNDEISHLAVTLNAMLDRIERGVLDKHQLIADASHELRTPLAVMRTELDVSLRGDHLSEPARLVLTSVLEEVQRMTRTVDNLLTLAQVDEGKLELLTAPNDIRRLAENAAVPVEPLAAASGVALTVGGEHWKALADAPRVELALTNLILNAITWTPAGGSVRVESWSRADEVGVTVTDQGPGIAAEHAEHLFERFYRAENARERAAGGSGLGLAICREVALAHGGRVWFNTQVGRGSAFSLALPGWRSLQRMQPRTEAKEASAT